jgi:GTP-binding protein
VTTLNPQEFPKNRLPEIAFIGRSNVGKSSLLNALCGQRKIAKVSSTPGRTRGLGFYLVNERLFFVDFPGYGFARVSQELKLKWKRVIEEYLGTRQYLECIVHVIDARHKPTDDDIMMHRWLVASEVTTITVATKLDKLSRSRRKDSLENIRTYLDMKPDGVLIGFSALTGEGKRELLELLDL